MVGVALLALCSGVRLSGQTAVVDPYSLPMVQAACGAEDGSGPQTSAGSHDTEAALKPGMARVYVITETRGLFGSLGKPVRLGMDGHWFGENHAKVYGYSYVDVPPGVHHLCVGARVRGAVPRTNHAVLLARVNAVAGQSYFFYNQYIRIAGIFTLRPVGAEDGVMYLQALPTSGIPKLWKTAEAELFCGADGNKMPNGPVPLPTLPGPPEAGKALVYFFLGTPQFGRRGVPIAIAVDRRWAGETQLGSYLAVPMAPGVHRLCASMKFLMLLEPTLHLGQLNVVAGKTYFVDLSTLQPVEQSVATVWLRRIAAMAKSDTPDMKSLKRWSRKDFPASPAELRACGIPVADGPVAAPAMLPATGRPPSSQVFLLLKTDGGWLNRYNAVNLGVDGGWAGSLLHTGWIAQPIMAGRHTVCIDIDPRVNGRLTIDPSASLYVGAVDVPDGESLYFKSEIVTDDAGGFYSSGRLDPDEGQLLVALYPHVDTLPR